MSQSVVQRPGLRSSSELRAVFGSAVALVLVASVLVFVLLGSQPLGIDDAYITLVYGRHLKQGLGFAFIPGGERVEGMTSMSWALVSAAVLVFTERPQVPLLLMSAGLLVLTVVYVHRILRVVTGDPVDARQRRLLLLLLLGWTACQPGLFAWNVLSLMESSLWTFLVTLATAQLAESAWTSPAPPPRAHHFRLAASAAAMALTRPESLALVPFMWLWATLVVARTSGLRNALRRYLPSLAAFVVVCAALLCFRLLYFGYPWPNTYYAKRTAHLLYSMWKGARYLIKFLTIRPWNAAALAVLLATFVPGLRHLASRTLNKPEGALLIVSGTVLFCLGLPLLSSGDAFGEFRFYQPIVLLLIVPVAYLLSIKLQLDRVLKLFSSGPRVALAALLALLFCFVVWCAFGATSQLEGEFTAATAGERVGEALTRSLKKTEKTLPTLGVIGAGGTAWTYEGAVLDLLGLNWTRMAHSEADRRGLRTGHGAFSAEVFWLQPPEILVLDLQRGAFCDADTPASALQTFIVTTWLRGLTQTPRFADAFEAGCLGAGASSVAGFFSREWLRTRPTLVYRPLGPEPVVASPSQ